MQSSAYTCRDHSQVGCHWTSHCRSFSLSQSCQCSSVPYFHSTRHRFCCTTYLPIYGRSLGASLSCAKVYLALSLGHSRHDLQLHVSPHASSDAGWGGCLVSRRSTSGYYVFLGDNLIFGLLNDRGLFLVQVSMRSTTTSLTPLQRHVGFIIYFVSFGVCLPKPR